jgi:hypothetical protein
VTTSKSSPKKTSDKKSSPKKTSDKKSSPKKTSDKKSSPKKTSDKKSSPKKTSDKKSSPKKTSDKKSSTNTKKKHDHSSSKKLDVNMPPEQFLKAAKERIAKLEEILKKNGATSAASLTQVNSDMGVTFYPDVEQWGEYVQMAAKHETI